MSNHVNEVGMREYVLLDIFLLCIYYNVYNNIITYISKQFLYIHTYMYNIVHGLSVGNKNKIYFGNMVTEWSKVLFLSIYFFQSSLCFTLNSKLIMICDKYDMVQTGSYKAQTP